MVYNYYLVYSACTETLPVALPAIKSSFPLTCHLAVSCTHITCCLEVEELARSVELYIQLDSCDRELIAAIDKLVYKKTLINYVYLQQENVQLKGVIHLE